MGGPLSVTLSDIHMIRMETDVVLPIRPIFYKRYIDGIYNRRQKNTSDVLYDALNNYHPKIKLTIETNPQRFLDTEIIHINGTIETQKRYTGRKQNCQYHGHQTFLKGIRETPLKQNYIVQSKFHQNLKVR